MKNCAVAEWGVLGARHGQRADGVLQAVIGFVLDRVTGRFLVEVLVETATLNHEAINDPVKQRAVVKTVAHVLLEIGCRNRGFFHD